MGTGLTLLTSQLPAFYAFLKPRVSFVRRKEEIGVNKKLRNIRRKHPTYVDGFKKKGAVVKKNRRGHMLVGSVFWPKNEVADRQTTAAANKQKD